MKPQKLGPTLTNPDSYSVKGKHESQADNCSDVIESYPFLKELLISENRNLATSLHALHVGPRLSWPLQRLEQVREGKTREKDVWQRSSIWSTYH